MIKMTIQDTEETAEFKVLEKPIIQKPLIAESDVVTIDNNLSTYVTGTQKRELTVGLGYLDSVGYETLRRIRDRQYAVLKYPTVTITADEPVDMGYGEDVPSYRQRLVQLKGKNILDPSLLVADKYIDESTGAIGTASNPNSFATEEYLPCWPNTTYTLSAGTRYMRVALYDDAKNKISVTSSGNSSTPVTVTTTATSKWMRVSATDTTGTKHVQLEKGSTATSYAPYFTPIELCKIGTYQDYIYKSGNKWYVHKEVGKYTFDGSESWIRSGRTTESVFVAAVTLTSSMIQWKIGSAYRALAKSDRFIAGTTTVVGHFDMYNGTDFYTSLAFMFDAVAIPDITAAKAWIATNKPTAYGILATYTNTEITNPLLVAQLEALTESAFYRWTKVETNVQEPSLQPYLTVTQGEITGSGKEVMLEGTTEDLLDFVILGDTFQDGTPTPDSPIPVQTVNGDIAFDFSGPSGVKRYTMVGKMTLADQRIIDNCGTNEQVQVSFRESKQL